MLSDCLTFFVSLFEAFFLWCDSFFLFDGVSYLALLIGAFMLYLVVDNLLIKGK